MHFGEKVITAHKVLRRLGCGQRKLTPRANGAENATLGSSKNSPEQMLQSSTTSKLIALWLLGEGAIFHRAVLHFSSRP